MQADFRRCRRQACERSEGESCDYWLRFTSKRPSAASRIQTGDGARAKFEAIPFLDERCGRFAHRDEHWGKLRRSGKGKQARGGHLGSGWSELLGLGAKTFARNQTSFAYVRIRLSAVRRFPSRITL